MPHIHEKIDFTVQVFIVRDHRVLLRRHDKYKIWLGVGGHIELDEDPNQAAIREAKEEVGLDIVLADEAFEKRRVLLKNKPDLIPPRFLHRHKINETHEHVDLVYFATTDSAKITQGEHEISDEIKWFTKDELHDKKYGIEDDIKHYAGVALETL